MPQGIWYNSMHFDTYFDTISIVFDTFSMDIRYITKSKLWNIIRCYFDAFLMDALTLNYWIYRNSIELLSKCIELHFIIEFQLLIWMSIEWNRKYIELNQNEYRNTSNFNCLFRRELNDIEMSLHCSILHQGFVMFICKSY